jgi:hypothetical protein
MPMYLPAMPLVGSEARCVNITRASFDQRWIAITPATVRDHKALAGLLLE